MENEILKEIQFLREGLSTFSKRLDQLESRIRTSPAPATSPPVPAPHAPSPAVAPRPPVPLKVTPAQPAGRRETLETRIGRDWLNRIGVASLVFGVVFFILYTFQYLGAGAKIAIGLACAASLIGGGVVLERRTGWRWYAVGLIGGGWALLYFTVYAAHHVQMVRILDSRVLDLVLLAAIAAGAVRHSLIYRSATITALAFVLGFITLSVSPVTYFTLAASVVLIGGIAGMAVRMRWGGLLLFGVATSYLTHAISLAPQIAFSPTIAIHAATTDISQFWLTAGFLALYWSAYTIAGLCLNEATDRRRHALLATLLLNGLAFVTYLLQAMEHVYFQQRYLVLIVLGGLYLAMGWATRRRLPVTSEAAILIGLTLATMAIPLHLTDRWTSALWTTEVGILAWLGLRSGRWAYRLFAFGLGVLVLCRLLFVDFANSLPYWMVLGPWAIRLSWRLLLGALGIGSFGLAAAAYHDARYHAAQRPVESQAFHLYVVAAGLLAWTLTALEAKSDLGFLWALEASAVVLWGWRLPDRGIRLMGLVWFAAAVLRTLFVWAGHSYATGGPRYLSSTDLLYQLAFLSGHAAHPRGLSAYGTIALLYGMSLLYRQTIPGRRFSFEENDIVRHGYSVAATTLLTFLLSDDISRHWLSPVWAVEGLLLVAAGFSLRDRVLRICGLVVFALMLCRVLAVDLAGVETIYRILSFLAVGAMLLVASFAYTKFSSGKLQEGTAEPHETSPSS